MIIRVLQFYTRNPKKQRKLQAMNVMNVSLDIYQTLAAAVAVYYIGVLLRLKIPFLRQYCIPAPVVGGILFAICNDIL